MANLVLTRYDTVFFAEGKLLAYPLVASLLCFSELNEVYMTWVPLRNSEKQKNKHHLGKPLTNVIVKKNSEDIRLCVKYVAVTAKMWKY